MLDLALCNELLAEDGLDLAAQARVAAELGCAGLELAPGTLAPEPHTLSPAEVDRARRTVEAEGIRVSGLHWVLTAYPHLSITDSQNAGAAAEVLERLVAICGDLGGAVFVHGSPGQRRRPEGIGDAELRAHLVSFFAPLAEAAERAGVVYCLEPLAPPQADVVTSVAEAADIVERVGHPAFRTMIDTTAAGRTKPPVADLLAQWLPTGLVPHVHFNDTNRGAPGMGEDWSGTAAVEPFRTCVDGRVTAGIGIATIRACERAVR